MEFQANRNRGTNRGPLLRRVVAGLLGFALALTGAVTLTSAAQAAAGTVNSIDITTIYDGAQVPNSVDDDANNGIVASNDVVGFRWDLNATDLTDGVFTQTLPEGWTWDSTSLGSLDSSSSAYQATYVVSEDGRTLTATVSIGNGSGNPSVVGFGTLKAIPSSDVPNGSVYEPVVTAAVDDTVETGSTDPIEVRNTPMANMTKVRGANNVLSEFDFGSGAVPARYIDFTVGISDARTAVGARNTEVAQPVVIDDSYTIHAPEGFENIEFVAEVASISEAGASVGIDQTGQELTLTFDAFSRIPSASAVIRFWVPDSAVPVDSLGAVRLVNTVAPSDWRDVNGDPVEEVPSGNTAEGTVVKPPSGPGAISRGKGVYLFNDQESDFSISGDPARSGQPYTVVSGKEVSVGSTIAARTQLRAGIDASLNTVTGARDLVAYDFWDATEQQIVDGADFFVGANGSANSLDSSDYTVQYTSGTDRDNPASNTWVNSIAAAGGVTNVSGVRIAYTAGEWASGGAPGSSYFVVALPFTIVAPSGSSAQDHARWSFTDVDGASRTAAVTQFVNVGQFALSVDKTADRTSIVSGSDVQYSLKPAVDRALGAIEDVEVRDLQIVDTLPAGLVAVDTDDVDPPWQVTRSGSAESGLTLTFTYDGVVTTGTVLPEIDYTVTTSVLAPADARLVNTAVIDARSATQTVAERSDSWTTTVYQAEVITEEKVVMGEEEIEVEDPQVSWETRWFNFQTSSQGESYFVDVLPYNGDGRGTDFSGTAKLASAMVTDGTGNPAADGYGSLQYTLDPAATVYAAEANDASINWIDADGVDLSTLSDVTALRVVVHDFESGAPGIGGLLVTMDVQGQKAGDRYVNNTNGWLGHSGQLGLSNPAEVNVVASSISGVVWHDVNGDGVLDDDETRLGSVAVNLIDAADNVIATVDTELDGTYVFDQLHSGEYRTAVDASTLGFPANHVVANTYDLDGDLNSDSGVIELGKATDRTDVDFGYVTRVSDIDLVKSGHLAGEARAGEWVNWEFVITNTGQNPLTAVELTDHLDGVVDLEVDWPGEAGVLAADESAPATARYQLVQADLDRGYVHNTATVTGLDPNSTLVEDPADATVTLPEGGSLLLEKDGELVGEAIAGGEVQWNFTLTNTGNVTLDEIEIFDDLEGLHDIVWGDWPAADFVLAPNESVTATAGYTLTQADVDAGFVHNTATSQGTTPGGDPVPSNEDDATVTYTPVSSISLVKKTNGVEYDSAPGAELTVGDEVVWTYEITNTGNTTLTDVVLVDDQEGSIAAPAGFDGVLAPGESVEYRATGVATAGDYHNVAVVTAHTPSGLGVTADDESWYHGSPAAAPGGLSLTGTSVLPLLLMGALLILAGAAVWLTRHRRA
ncbi:DUF7507 domain-containing protein [Leucobacter sp. GX24907]